MFLPIELDAMLPPVRTTELLHEVSRTTGLASAFTNLRTGESCDNENALLAAILADASNLGLTRMAAASEGVTRDQLIWTAAAYIRPETYKAALAKIIDAHHALPIAAIWGDGTTSSSDGQFFRSGKRGDTAGEVNARYGVDPGINFYTHVSDQHGPYNIKVMSATNHEAPDVLDGLMHHGTQLKIDTHYVDTGGASDHVCILCAMLGFRFCPRLRDFPDRRLACIEPAASYEDLQPLLGRRIKAAVVREHWGEVRRLIASLKAGTVAPSAMLKKLAAYRRRNQLDLALQELGRIERTLFMLNWLESPELRRRCQAGLNSRPEQERAASCPRPGRLHLQAGPDHGPWPRGPAVQGVRAKPRHRRYCLLELHLYRRRRGASARSGGSGARPVVGSHDAAELGAHRPVGRLPVRSSRGNRRENATAQPRPPQDRRPNRGS